MKHLSWSSLMDNLTDMLADITYAEVENIYNKVAHRLDQPRAHHVFDTDKDPCGHWEIDK